VVGVGVALGCRIISQPAGDVTVSALWMRRVASRWVETGVPSTCVTISPGISPVFFPTEPCLSICTRGRIHASSLSEPLSIVMPCGVRVPLRRGAGGAWRRRLGTHQLAVSPVRLRHADRDLHARYVARGRSALSATTNGNRVAQTCACASHQRTVNGKQLSFIGGIGLFFIQVFPLNVKTSSLACRVFPMKKPYSSRLPQQSQGCAQIYQTATTRPR